MAPMLSCPIHKTPSAIFPSDQAQKVCELCSLFYSRGWLNAAGGNFSIRDENVIYIAPAVAREASACPISTYVIEINGQTVEIRERGSDGVEHKQLLILPYVHAAAGAVLHSHSMNAMLITQLFDKEFNLTGDATGQLDKSSIPKCLYRIPILENLSDTKKMTELFVRSIKKYSQTQALLIRGHGIYVWGTDWAIVQSLAETSERLFEAAIGATHMLMKKKPFNPRA